MADFNDATVKLAKEQTIVVIGGTYIYDISGDVYDVLNPKTFEVLGALTSDNSLSRQFVSGVDYTFTSNQVTFLNDDIFAYGYFVFKVTDDTVARQTALDGADLSIFKGEVVEEIDHIYEVFNVLKDEILKKRFLTLENSLFANTNIKMPNTGQGIYWSGTDWGLFEVASIEGQKAILDDYVQNVLFIELDNYVADTLEPILDDYIETVSKVELDNYNLTVKIPQLDSHVTNTSIPQIETATSTGIGEINDAKDQAILDIDSLYPNFQYISDNFQGSKDRPTANTSLNDYRENGIAEIFSSDNISDLPSNEGSSASLFVSEVALRNGTEISRGMQRYYNISTVSSKFDNWIRFYDYDETLYSKWFLNSPRKNFLEDQGITDSQFASATSLDDCLSIMFNSMEVGSDLLFFTSSSSHPNLHSFLGFALDTGSGNMKLRKTGGLKMIVEITRNFAPYYKYFGTYNDGNNTEFFRFIKVDADGKVVEEPIFKNIIHFEGATGTNGRILKNNATSPDGLRDELLIYANDDAYDTNSKGSGIQVYGNQDQKHPSGGIYLLTGNDGEGAGRFSITRNGNIVIGKNQWAYGDAFQNKAHVTFKYNSDNSQYGDSPGLLFSGYSASNGEIAEEDGGRIDFGHYNVSSGSFTGQVALDSNGNWISTIDGGNDLGRAASRWGTVYATSGSINTSDERMKTDLLELDEAEYWCAKECQKAIRKFKFKDAIEKKGEDGARIHFGVGAQTIADIFIKYDLDPTRYALFCYDEWDDEYDVNDETLLIVEKGNRYGIRYDELLCFIISAL